MGFACRGPFFLVGLVLAFTCDQAFAGRGTPPHAGEAQLPFEGLESASLNSTSRKLLQSVQCPSDTQDVTCDVIPAPAVPPPVRTFGRTFADTPSAFWRSDSLFNSDVSPVTHNWARPNRVVNLVNSCFSPVGITLASNTTNGDFWRIFQPNGAALAAAPATFNLPPGGAQNNLLLINTSPFPSRNPRTGGILVTPLPPTLVPPSPPGVDGLFISSTTDPFAASTVTLPGAPGVFTFASLQSANPSVTAAPVVIAVTIFCPRLLPVNTPPVTTPPAGGVVTLPAKTPPVTTPPVGGVVTPPVSTPPIVIPPATTTTPPIITPPAITTPVTAPPVTTTLAITPPATLTPPPIGPVFPTPSLPIPLTGGGAAGLPLFYPGVPEAPPLAQGPKLVPLPSTPPPKSPSPSPDRPGHDRNCDYYPCRGHNRPGHRCAKDYCPGHNRPGNYCAGYDCPGDQCPGYNRPGHNCPGHCCADHYCPGHNRPGHYCPGYNCPGYSCAEDYRPGHNCPGHECLSPGHNRPSNH
ncbi:hypothetical protein KFL_001460070 [Klebsormidium nitens]|uniref:Uncharacterized protein n=1 Tax=Klebsormidium nitens TaxID=105231 RepID=A0A1Y1HXJ3_KLENI|nr:hypothetical protein KFL_001460070 [Klebsormidium nitens]|eukprot:GAQ83380.1 hypothetical protein KFL_001460070 [Klebsormidium nitens]